MDKPLDTELVVNTTTMSADGAVQVVARSQGAGRVLVTLNRGAGGGMYIRAYLTQQEARVLATYILEAAGG